MDLRSRLDEILEMCTSEEVSQVHELTVVFILDINHTPSVLTSTDLLSVHNDGLLRSNDGKWDDVLDLRIKCTLLLIKLIVIVGVHLQVVEDKLLLDSLLECCSLLQGEGVRLGNDGNHVDNIRQLLQNNDIDRLERVTRRLNEEQAAVDTGILDITFSLSSELLAEISRVLVLDVFHNRVPASVVVDLITITGGIDDIETKPHAVFLDDVRNGLDLGGRSDRFIRGKTTLGIDEVSCEDCIDQSRLSETSLTNTDHVELKSTLKSFLSICAVMLSKPTWLRGKTAVVWAIVLCIIEIMER